MTDLLSNIIDLLIVTYGVLALTYVFRQVTSADFELNGFTVVRLSIPLIVILVLIEYFGAGL